MERPEGGDLGDCQVNKDCDLYYAEADRDRYKHQAEALAEALEAMIRSVERAENHPATSTSAWIVGRYVSVDELQRVLNSYREALRALDGEAK